MANPSKVYLVNETVVQSIIDNIDAFDAYCAAREQTDTNEAWEIFYWIRSMLQGSVEEDSKPELDIHFREQSPF